MGRASVSSSVMTARLEVSSGCRLVSAPENVAPIANSDPTCMVRRAASVARSMKRLRTASSFVRMSSRMRSKLGATGGWPGSDLAPAAGCSSGMPDATGNVCSAMQASLKNLDARPLRHFAGAVLPGAGA